MASAMAALLRHILDTRLDNMSRVINSHTGATFRQSSSRRNVSPPWKCGASLRNTLRESVSRLGRTYVGRS